MGTDIQTGTDQWGDEEEELGLIFDGEDYTHATFMRGIILPILNRTKYLKNRVDVVYSDSHTWQELQTFESGATFQGPVVFQGSVELQGNLAVLKRRHVLLAAGSATIDATTGDIFRVPATLGGAIVLTLKKASPTPPTGYPIRFYRTKSASAHTVGFAEETSGRSLGAWEASKQAWADFVFDGTKWHMCGWDVGGTDNGTSDTSDT